MSETLAKLEKELKDRKKVISELKKSIIADIKAIEIEMEERKQQIQLDYQGNFDEESRIVAEIETAIMVVRRLESNQVQEIEIPELNKIEKKSEKSPTVYPGPSIRRVRKPGRKKSLKGTTANQAAHAVLDDSGDEFIEPSEVARRAIARGYLGRIFADDVEKNAVSFFDVLRRRPHLYLRDDRDRFRLRREYDPPYVAPDHLRFYEGSRAWMAEQILKNRDQPMTPTEIAKKMVEKGMVTGENIRAISNALLSSLNRHAQFEKVDEGLYRLRRVKR